MARPEEPVLPIMATGCACSSRPALPGQAVDSCILPHVAHSFQWVLAFEIFIPLVLFFILLGLRQKKPTISVKEGEVQV